MRTDQSLLAVTFPRLERSLLENHPSLNSETNPVLIRLRKTELTIEQAKFALRQYCFLPAEIVNFLTTGANRLSHWKKVGDELNRNVGEELGSRTSGLSHFEILKNALRTEVGLNISAAVADQGTSGFLAKIRDMLLNAPSNVVAGIIYALEVSAIPELTIVAEIINSYAILKGAKGKLINTTVMGEATRATQARNQRPGNYSLEDFFTLHLLDFEVGHRSGLETTLQEYVCSPKDIAEFTRGFEFLLTAMDEWWISLSEPRKDSKLQVG